MNSIGIVRKVDELGRIVIPKETRSQLTVAEGDSLEIFVDEDEHHIILRKYAPGCIFCNSLSDVSYFKGVRICQKCKDELKDLAK
ncbi:MULTISPECIES: AbrB/MazE/SpoVT family DNA-binding domain-containing protein [Clostridium]|uniref:AbrB/MazE/SpoVT family DNA-binding domain-containing protein n=1 Tax=Clostridium TaxID=1485 RepID=UPI00082479F3|nr:MULTISPECIES: AbrB/MazE/SpoVT family DNA-binding domain-containing protein [Clostridium]PJI08428.1 AbrB family transcriptional regulator [Clostridium sp. CT7]